MYYLNKIVGWGLSPLGILFLGLALGGLLQRGGEAGILALPRRLGRWIVGLTLVLVWVLGCGVTTRLIGVPLEGNETDILTNHQSPTTNLYDAVVLLGGGMGAHEKCGRAEMFSGADRVWMAARVWREEVEKVGGERQLKIFCSGGGVALSTVPLLVDLGVPREAITCLPQPRNTEEEAKSIAGMLGDTAAEAARGTARVLLVTSAWHMPRARMLFERAGVDVVPVPCDYEMNMIAERPLEFGDFLPNAEAMMRNTWALKEWVARLGYGLLRRSAETR